MTFIASVVAKKGVAIIADSLVTTSKSSLDLQSFMEYLKSKKDSNTDVDLAEIVQLFSKRPSHTKDYEQKLFKYDEFTAITTAGTAEINGNRISELIQSIIDKNNRNKTTRETYARKRISTKVNDFINELTNEIKAHIRKHGDITETIFIITHFDKTTHKTIIYKLKVVRASEDDLKKNGFKYIESTLQKENYKVTCDGQNRISDRILFGDIHTFMAVVPQLLTKIRKDFKVKSDKIEEADYRLDLFRHVLGNSKITDDMQIFQLSDLSLQQSVDLACLLMRIEMDFQKYTKNIPTVGGIIKLAVIDDDGFRYINGQDVIKPDFIS